MGPEYTMELIPRTQYMFESDKDPLTLFNPKFLVCVCVCGRGYACTMCMYM